MTVGKGLFRVIIITIVIIIVTVLLYPNQGVSSNSLKISVSEARSRRFGMIFDARTLKERDVLGYYPNSIPISAQRLQQEVPLDISSKNTWILVYSNNDNRAVVAAEILYKMGYKNVRYIKETYLSLMPGSS